MFNLKVASSFTCDHDILFDFHTQIGSHYRSKVIQSLIKQFLEDKKSGSGVSILQSPKSVSNESPKETKL